MQFHARLDYVERRDSRGPTGTNRALGSPGGVVLSPVLLPAERV